MAERLMRRPDVLHQIGLDGKTSTLYDWMAKGHFPRPVQIGPRAVAWRESDVQAFIDSRASQGTDSNDRAA